MADSSRSKAEPVGKSPEGKSSGQSGRAPIALIDLKAQQGLIRDRLDFLSAADKEWLLRKTAERVFFS